MKVPYYKIIVIVYVHVRDHNIIMYYSQKYAHLNRTQSLTFAVISQHHYFIFMK